jgi:hypothetical protein
MKTKQWNILKLFSEGRKEMKENNGRGDSKIYCKHICKCHNVSSPVQLLFAKKNILCWDCADFSYMKLLMRGCIFLYFICEEWIYF